MEKYENSSNQCVFTARKSTDKIVYIICPQELDHNDVFTWAEKYDCNICVVYGIDWDNDLTPWPAAGVPKGSPNFKGDAKMFLDHLKTEIIPTVEKSIGYVSQPSRTLLGVSLSGLFALWEWSNDDFFYNMCSISGSFWYEGFIQWLRQQPFGGKKGKAYFSLGVEEPHSKNKTFATVGDATQEAVEIVKSHGIDTTFKWVPGDHYAAFVPRVDLALESIYASN